MDEILVCAKHDFRAYSADFFCPYCAQERRRVAYEAQRMGLSKVDFATVEKRIVAHMYQPEEQEPQTLLERFRLWLKRKLR